MGVTRWLKKASVLPGALKARHLAEVTVTPHLRGELAEVRAEVVRVSQRVADLERHLPPVLNAISSTNGMARQLRRELRGDLAPHIQSIEWLLQRVEMVRAEMLHELRYGAHGASGGQPAAAVDDVEVRVVTAGCLDGSDVRLNLGAGHVPIEGYANVDMRALPGVDVVARLDDLPVEKGTVAEIFSSHVLEHFPREQLVRTMLPYWYGLLRHGGVFRAVVPDLEAMSLGYAHGTISFADFREVVYGGQEYEGDTHFNGFTPDDLVTILGHAGFAEVTIVEAARRNGRCLELEISAVKPDVG